MRADKTVMYCHVIISEHLSGATKNYKAVIYCHVVS
jgi:hypothetical protein